jgi:hypothetical protein
MEGGRMVALLCGGRRGRVVLVKKEGKKVIMVILCFLTGEAFFVHQRVEKTYSTLLVKLLFNSKLKKNGFTGEAKLYPFV